MKRWDELSGRIAWTDKKVILVILVILFLGLLVGSSIGSYITIKAIVSVTGGFVNEGLIRAAIYQYQNNIANCFPSNLSF